ncbi:MAG: WD40 repeat domain-containing protein [Pseudonocardiaceae bacterium]
MSRDLTLRLWEGRTAEVVPTPHDHFIKCVSASTDGRLVATGSYNGVLAIYDLAERCWRIVPRQTTSGISSLHYGDARRIFLASSYDGAVYEVPRGEA